MDRFLFSCPSNGIDSLDWTESEVRSQSSVSIVGDSQFPLSLPVCPDSQEIEIRCVRPDRLSPVNSLKSFETAESLDMDRWDLADGEIRSESSGSRLVHAHTLVCPPPSLDTQEFEIRCMRSGDLSPEKGPQSSEKSSLREMNCWDLGEGEAISQDAVRSLCEAETPSCPPVSLDSQEFVRRCVEQDGIMSMESEDNLERSSPDALDACDLADGEARSRPLKALVGENMSLCPPSPINVQGRANVELKLTRLEDVSSMHSLRLSEVALGEESSKRPVSKLYFDTEAHTRLECSLTRQEFASRWEAQENVSAVNAITSLDFALDESSRRSSCLHLSRSQSPQNSLYRQNSLEVEDSKVPPEDNVKENKFSDYSELVGCEVRPETPLSHARSLLLKTKCSAAVQGEVHGSNPASSLDAPLITPTPETDGNVNGHLTKRKNQDLFLSTEDEVLATTTKRSLKKHLSISNRNSPRCRSTLRPLSVNPRLINNVNHEEVYKARQCHELKVLMSKAEGFENMADVAVAELFLSGEEYLIGKENVELQKIPKEVGATVSTTSTSLVKIDSQFDAGDGHPKRNYPKHPFQSSEQVHIHDIRPKSILQLDTNTLDRGSPCSLLTSRVGLNNYRAKTEKLVSEDHERIQGWLCPQASKRLLSRKPRQRLLDTWLK